MFKKTIKYKDYDDQEVEGDFFFNMRKDEIIEMELNAGNAGFQARMQQLMVEKNNAEIYRIFKSLILDAYGKPVVENGVKKFKKSDDIRDEFVQTGAFSELIVGMMQNEREAADFIENAFPRDLVREAQKEIDEIKKSLPESTES